MDEERFKVIIKGQGGKYSVKTSGSVNNILMSMTQALVEIAIEYEVTKKIFLEIMQATFEEEMQKKSKGIK